jgi:UDP-perosamine 4-acetyltransferase
MKTVIIGAGGHGRVVLDILRSAGSHQVVGFLDSNPLLAGRMVDGLPVLGRPDALLDLRRRGIAGAIIAIGDNHVRTAFARSIDALGIELVNAIHPSAQIASTAALGRNIAAAAGAIVSAHARIADSVILNTGCIVDHECDIGAGTHICPGARLAGHVTVEPGAFIGIGATLIQNIRIGFEAVVGAGAVVLGDVHPMTTVVGVPAREIKSAPSAAELEALLAHAPA